MLNYPLFKYFDVELFAYFHHIDFLMLKGFATKQFHGGKAC